MCDMCLPARAAVERSPPSHTQAGIYAYAYMPVLISTGHIMHRENTNSDNIIELMIELIIELMQRYNISSSGIHCRNIITSVVTGAIVLLVL